MRRQAGLAWLQETIQENFGKKGWDRLQASVDASKPPFAQWQALSAG